ncbi:alpha-L-rhamnosidase A, partial [Fusarium albosuccineum]
MQNLSMPHGSPKFVRPIRVLRTSGKIRVEDDLSNISLENVESSTKADVILDYGRCEGGFPVFSIASASAPKDHHQVAFQVTYSETIDGIDHET